MTAAEQVYELLKAMPPHQVGEVLDFAKFLKQKAASHSGVETTHTSDDSGLLAETVEPDLKPLITLPGYIPDGWKDAIY